MVSIVCNETIRSGSPRIEGTRITVLDIKQRVIDSGESRLLSPQSTISRLQRCSKRLRTFTPTPKPCASAKQRAQSDADNASGSRHSSGTNSKNSDGQRNSYERIVELFCW